MTLGTACAQSHSPKPFTVSFIVTSAAAAQSNPPWLGVSVIEGLASVAILTESRCDHLLEVHREPGLEAAGVRDDTVGATKVGVRGRKRRYVALPASEVVEVEGVE